MPLDEQMRTFGLEKSTATLTQLVLGMCDESATTAGRFLRGVLPLVAPAPPPAPALEDVYEDDDMTFDYFKEDNVDEQEMTLMLLIPESAIVNVIGDAGATVKQIQAATGTSISIQPSSAMVPGQLERQVDIVGTLISTNVAQYMITLQARQRMIADGTLPNDPRLDVLVPNSSVSFLIGKQGSTVSEIQHVADASVSITRTAEMLPGLAGRAVNISAATMYSRMKAQYLVSRTVCQHQMIGTSGNMGDMAYPSIHGGVELYVPNHLIPRLIGKRGSCVTELQTQTGARIQIQRENEMAPGQTTGRKVTLGGAPASVQSCKMLIERMVQDWERELADGQAY